MLLKFPERTNSPLSHHEVDNISGVSSSRDPPLVSIHYNLISFDSDASLDVGGTVRQRLHQMVCSVNQN